MPGILTAAVFVMVFASCASDDESTSSTSVVVIDSVQASVQEATTQEPEVSSSPSASMTSPASTALRPPSSAISLVEVTSDCGPTDGNWVRGALTSSDTQTVFAQLSVDGVTYGRSDIVVLEAGVETTIGFDPQRPNEAFGKIGQFEVVVADTQAVIANADVVLKIPDGVGCG